jgi:hypothetical protein
MYTRNKYKFNTILRCIGAAYVIVFMPIVLAYLALGHFTRFTGRMLVYALIPLACVLIILYLVYFIRVVRTGRFWSGSHVREDLQTAQNEM